MAGFYTGRFFNIRELALLLLVFASIGWASAASPSDLVLKYNFNETSSGPAVDLSGNNYDGTWNGDITSGVDGPQNFNDDLAYDFDGTGDYVDAGDKSNLEGMSELTVSAWVYPESFETTDVIVGKGDRGYAIQAHSSSWRMLLGDGNSTWQVVKEGGTADTGHWSMITMTYDGSEAILYENDTKLASSLQKNGSIETSSLNLLVGEIYDGGSPGGFEWNGKIDQVRIYDKALTSSEVNTLFNNGELSSGGGGGGSGGIRTVSLECEINGTTWDGCSNATTFGSTIERMRANFTGENVQWANFTLADEYDHNFRFHNKNASSQTNYYIYDNPDQTVDDSGDWNASVKIEQTNGTSDNIIQNWSVSWGSLSVTLDKPSSNKDVEKDTTFNMSGTATCSGGECASETDGSGGGAEKVKVWADPKGAGNPVKLESSEGRVGPGERVGLSSSRIIEISKRVPGHSGTEPFYVRGKHDPDEMLEKIRKNGVDSHKHRNRENGHTHSHGDSSHVHDEKGDNSISSLITETFYTIVEGVL